ncbi:MAG: 2-C-methyl-D-erythritol 4-phosphate cytidylyltransferase [Dehalococcoidia bacterium]|nr:MAG: 2-C-methyl-D-erythritol 4-phosphate cytidylyltransferase [Dehalococcoidia bacterium]
MKITAIIPAAGCGRRMRLKEDKPFIKICGKEMICYPLSVLERISAVSEVVVVAERKNIFKMKVLVKREGFRKVKHIIEGGRWRCQSVSNGLKASSEDSDFILIHDCARPLIEKGIIEKTIRAALKNNCVIAAVRVKPTIKQVFTGRGFVQHTLNRALLWEAQTPQIFKACLFREAYRKAGKSIRSFTDDSGIVENAGNRVRIVESNYRNIKITTREDLVIAEALMKN